MSNSSCSFPSINDVLNQADAGTLNITTIINACPDICTLAWGTGNPDLSGIGANISYIIQAVLTVICGPFLCVLYGSHDGSLVRKRTQKRLARLHDTFTDTSALFSIPIAIAAVIRIRQQPPFYELAFMRFLTTMQFLGLLSTAVTARFFDGKFRKSHCRVAIIISCSSLFIVPAIVLGLMGKEGARWCVVPMSLAFAIAMLVELVKMERTRAVMQTVTGGFFVDNQWGFGQVLAVFLWIPFGIQLVYFLLGCLGTSDSEEEKEKESVPDANGVQASESV